MNQITTTDMNNKNTRRHGKVTTMRRLLFTFLIVCLILADTGAVYGQKKAANEKLPISVHGKEATVYCLNTDTFVYNKNNDVKIYPASTTKIMTGILAIEEGDYPNHKTDPVTVSHEAVFGIPRDSSNIAIKEGEKVKFQDLLYGLMLCSGNDCAIALAEYIGGSVPDFADMMNAKAEEIGCVGTHFVNPNGLYDDEHYTTCHDLALMLAYAVQNEDFVAIDSTLKYNMAKTNKTDEVRVFWNNHRMLENKYLYYEPVVCGKSGYVDESLYNLVTYGKKDGMELVVVSAGNLSPDLCCQDTKDLMEYYFNNYEIAEIDTGKADVSSVTVEEVTVPVTAKGKITVLQKKGKDGDELDYETRLVKDAALPLKKGDQIGDLRYLQDGEIVGSVPLLVTEDVDAPTHIGAWILRLGLVSILLIGILYVIRARNPRKRRNPRSKRYR